MGCERRVYPGYSASVLLHYCLLLPQELLSVGTCRTMAVELVYLKGVNLHSLLLGLRVIRDQR